VLGRLVFRQAARYKKFRMVMKEILRMWRREIVDRDIKIPVIRQWATEQGGSLAGSASDHDQTGDCDQGLKDRDLGGVFKHEAH
jgi:hypothetical protein